MLLTDVPLLYWKIKKLSEIDIFQVEFLSAETKYIWLIYSYIYIIYSFGIYSYFRIFGQNSKFTAIDNYSAEYSEIKRIFKNTVNGHDFHDFQHEFHLLDVKSKETCGVEETLKHRNRKNFSTMFL